MTSRGFIELTNFTIDVYAQIHSEKYKVKGNREAFDIRIALNLPNVGHVWTINFQHGSTHKVFIPKAARGVPENFESFLDIQLVRLNIILDVPKPSWREYILKKIKAFDQRKQMYFVEYIGKQVHTVSICRPKVCKGY